MNVEERKKEAWTKGIAIEKHKNKYCVCYFDEITRQIDFDRPHLHRIVEARYIDLDNNAFSGYAFDLENRGIVFFGSESTSKSIKKYISDNPDVNPARR